MRTVRSDSGARKVPTPALLGPAILTVALLGTAALSVQAATPVTAAPTANQAATALGASTAAAPGWRVVARIGPVNGSVSGLLTADSASDAWSVWSGQRLTLVEHWTGQAWKAVRLPASMVRYARAAVAIGASSSSDVWLFNSHAANLALRWNGTAWGLVKIPAWALRRDHSGRVPAAGRSAAWVKGGVPADIIGSLVPDGSGGLWATGTAVTAKGEYGVILKFGP